MLRRISKHVALELSVVEIDSDPELQRRYLVEIPVVVADGTEVARAPISEAALEDALRAISPLAIEGAVVRSARPQNTK